MLFGLGAGDALSFGESFSLSSMTIVTASVFVAGLLGGYGSARAPFARPLGLFAGGMMRVDSVQGDGSVCVVTNWYVRRPARPHLRVRSATSFVV